MTTENSALNKIDDALSSLEQNMNKLQADLETDSPKSNRINLLAKGNRMQLNQIITDYNYYLNEIEETRLRMKGIETTILASGDAINNMFTHIDNA